MTKLTDYVLFFTLPVILLHSWQTDPIEFVEKICENMQLFPKEDFLCGDQLMFEYSPEVCVLYPSSITAWILM